MVIDSSALIAIMMGEPERRLFIDAIVAAEARLIAGPTMLEACIVVLSRRGDQGLNTLNTVSSDSGIDTVYFGSEHVSLAIDAFRRYGKGRRPARLNFGDCCAYALAKATGEPLLFKGDDLSQTDAKTAL